MNEIVNAYVKNILAPQVVSRTHPAKINQFYETLLYIVQSFEKLGKTLELLEINAELVPSCVAGKVLIFEGSKWRKQTPRTCFLFTSYWAQTNTPR